MKSIVKYGLFASALIMAAFVGHVITQGSYEDSFAQLALQNKKSTGAEEVPGLNRLGSNSGSEQISPELTSRPERIGSPEQTRHDPARSSAINTKLDSMTADQAAKAQLAKEKSAKERAIQASAQTPATQPPAASKKAAGEIGSQQNAAAGQNGSSDNAASGRTETASDSNSRGMPREPLTGVSGNSRGDMLAILSPLLKLTDGQPLGTEAIEGRALLVVVWASWCGACNEQLSALETFKSKLGNPNLDIIIVAMDENLDDARKAIVRRQINSPVVIGTEQFLTQVQLLGLPGSCFSDSQGGLQLKVVGDSGQDLAIFEQKIRSMLAEVRANPEKPAAVVSLARGEGGAEL